MPTVQKVARTDAGLAAELRVSVMRLRRRLANERHPDNELSLDAMAVLGCLYRNGDLTVGELAAHERVQPPSMTRTVNCLEEAATSSAARTRPTAARSWSALTDRAAAAVLADRDRRDAWLGPAPARADPRRARAVLRQAAPDSRTASPRRTDLPPLESHVPLPRQPQLPPLRRRRRGVEHRHLDAAGRPGLAGAQLTGNGGTALGITTGLQFLPVPAALAVRRPGRRPVPQATPAAADPVGMAAARAGPRPARRHRHRPDLARLRAGVRARHRRGLRRAGPAVVRVRDGRPRRPDQRRRPQLAPASTPPASSARRSPALLIAALGGGRGRHRLGDPGQRGQLRRADHDPAQRSTSPTAAHAEADRPARRGRSASGVALRPRPARPDAGPGDRLLRRHLRPELPDHLGADGDRGVRQGRRRVRPARHVHGRRLADRRAARRPPERGSGCGWWSAPRWRFAWSRSSPG